MIVSGIYRCSAGETFDSIALDVFGHEKYAADILSVNPRLSGTTVFTGGERLNIPALTITAHDAESEYAPAVAPWKR